MITAKRDVIKVNKSYLFFTPKYYSSFRDRIYGSFGEFSDFICIYFSSLLPSAPLVITGY